METIKVNVLNSDLFLRKAKIENKKSSRTNGRVTIAI